MSLAILSIELRFPDPNRANSEGLVAIGGDLSQERLLLGYTSGVFPWTVRRLVGGLQTQGRFST